MEFLGVLLFVGIIAFILFLGYLRKQATRALNRAVFDRAGHARGQDATKETVEFVVSVPPATVIDAVRARLALPVEAPGPFVAKIYLAEDRPGVLVFAYGNKVSQTFRSALTVESLPAGGSKGTYTVLNWVEGDGIVRGVPEMELLANTIRTCAAELGATYGTAVASSPVPAVPMSPPASAALFPALIATDAGTKTQFCTSCGSAHVGNRFCTDCGADNA